MDKKDSTTSTILRRIASSTLHQQFKVRINLARTTLGILLIVSTSLLSACKSSAPMATSVPTQIPATSVPTQIPVTSTPIPKAISAPLKTSAPTALDPCQLLNSQEAAKLTGVSYGSGKEGTIPGGMKSCIYGGNTTNILTVDVIKAADKATADAAEKQFQDEIQSNMQDLSSEGIQITQVPNFADTAFTAQANVSAGGASLSGSVFGFRKGTIFFGFSDVAIGGTAPSEAAMQSEAKTVLGRLP